MSKDSLKAGFSFGVTSGIITTLGLMVGLNSGTHSRLAVIGGVLTIAVADSLSDSLGIHISEESENHHTHKEVWVSTISTLVSKLAFALSFLVPILLFELSTAIVISLIWGGFMLSFLSYCIARGKGTNPWRAVGEHLFIALLVINITHFVGKWISLNFG
ncbi:MAG: hypothetical protein GF375_07015 [Candidatus Omnitrophica bacterium]|nr:hypothetical protein [Candidatus Omnitrophota bacterium]MBD3269727.1 hypothetical protein [Candidatus Omnitrophota bacterium]